MFTTPRLLRKGLFVVLVALTTSCLASAQATASQKTTPANQKTQTAAEKYEPLQNPSELGLDVQVAASYVSFGNSAGGQVEGKITSLSIAGKQLELTNAEIVQDANGSWINTKAYGRIKIASGALGRGLVISLTASQKASLTKLYNATKSSK
jgi:hypothetical protein